MATIAKRKNGKYLVRISCGRDIMTGKQIVRGKTFAPSKPNLSKRLFEKELDKTLSFIRIIMEVVILR